MNHQIVIIFVLFSHSQIKRCFSIRIHLNEGGFNFRLLDYFEKLHKLSNDKKESSQAEARSVFLQLLLLISNESIEEIRFSERISDGINGTISRYYP